MAMGTVKRTEIVYKENARVSELKIHFTPMKPATTSVSKILDSLYRYTIIHCPFFELHNFIYRPTD